MTDLERRIKEVTEELNKEESKHWLYWDMEKRAILIEELTDLLDRYAGIK